MSLSSRCQIQASGKDVTLWHLSFLLTIKLTAIFCSPVVVLLGQDQFNQSAVVVLGDKTSDNISPGDDISAVIGEVITPCKILHWCWYEGQVVTNLSPSIGESIRVAEGGDDIFSTLLESSDQGPIVLDELPEVWEILLPPSINILNKTSIKGSQNIKPRRTLSRGRS